MNAPLRHARAAVSAVDLHQPDEAARIEAFVTEQRGSVFHRPAWLLAVERGTGQRAAGLICEQAGAVIAWLPLSVVHSGAFGSILASSGFAVGGGVLGDDLRCVDLLARGAEDLAARLACSSIEWRGGQSPTHWQARTDSHCGFAATLADSDEAQLAAIPRKQRAEVRKGLAANLAVTVGSGERDRSAHFAVYSESVRNLGTPVFPRALFAAALDQLDADILTVWDGVRPVASVLSLYHDGAVLPYWGGGIAAARTMRANDRMYLELMRHARARGCTRFDFGRSKTGSGAYHFKRNWGFEPEPLSYATWSAPGAPARDADPTSARHAARIAAWKRLPLSIANRLGPLIARGLG